MNIPSASAPPYPKLLNPQPMSTLPEYGWVFVEFEDGEVIEAKAKSVQLYLRLPNYEELAIKHKAWSYACTYEPHLCESEHFFNKPTT